MLALALIAAAAAEDSDEGEAMVVEEERRKTSATEKVLDRTDVEAMPGRSADDLLRAMPGLHQSAHGGHGKAYQYFLRGFDAVHGSDLAVSVEGVPMNELSNVHAHGYLDLHFLPSILVQGIELWPGTSRPEAGDFAIAGSADFHVGLEDPGGQVWLGAGTDKSAIATVAWRPPRSGPETFVVADLDLGEGIGESREWRQVKAAAGGDTELGSAHVRGWLVAYDGVFESPGVLREDDYDAGEVDFYDAYPGSGGGHSSRVLGSVEASGANDGHAWEAMAYGGWRAFELRQNFTGYIQEPEHGDGTLQTYRTVSLGGSGAYHWFPLERLAIRSGVTVRAEILDQLEESIEEDGTVWREDASLDAEELDVGAWIAAPIDCTDWLWIQPGLRADVFVIAPEDTVSWAPVLAPKFTSTIFESAPVTGFLSYGRGFRSPDARGVGAGRAPVATADAYEVGATADPVQDLGFRAAAFGTFVSDEIVFDFAEAQYVATGSTRRLGIDGGVTVQATDALRFEGDATYSDGRYTKSGEPIPYAPRLLVVLGAFVEEMPVSTALLTAGLRAWGLGPRPLPDGFASHAAFVVDLTTELSLARWMLSLDVDNVLGSHWRDGEFLFPSHWDLDQPAAELPARHFTAGAPRALRLALGRRF